MMKLRAGYVFISCLWLVVGCSQEDYVRNYPQIVSIEITENTSDGINVGATLGGVNIDKIIDHGFILTSSVFSDSEIHLGKPTTNNFSTQIRSQLKKGLVYNVKAFLQTDKITVYGAELTFTSLGSAGPVITAVSPTTILPGDVVIITGKNFGNDNKKISVFIDKPDETNAQLQVTALTDTKITAKVPVAVFFQTAKIGVETTDDGLIAWSEPVTGQQPALTGVASANKCSPIQVTGTDLLLPGTPTRLSVNSVQVTPLPSFTNTSFSIPASFHSSVMRISVQYGDTYNLLTDFEDSAPMPVVTSVPSGLDATHTFIVQGTNFPTCGGLTIQTDYPTAATISDVTATQFTVNVSAGYCSAFTFSLSYRGTKIFTSNPIESPPAFTITSVSPLSGKAGDHITIKGTDLNNVEGVFIFTATLKTSGTPTQLDAIVAAPPDFDVNIIPDGNISLTISGCSNLEAYPFHLDLIPITITNVTPTVVGSIPDIIITGTNFLSDENLSVVITNPSTGEDVFPYSGTPITEKSDTRLRVQPPYSSGYSGKANVIIRSFGRTIVGATQIQIN
ncbi:MAG: IPT/TIG domain-containing protein [Bacteroidota bacterium]